MSVHLSEIEMVYRFNQAVDNRLERGEINWKMLRQALDHCKEELAEMEEEILELDARIADDAPLELRELCEFTEPVVDGALDLIYVAANVLYAMGISDPYALFTAIHKANMRKILPDGTVLRNPAGKVMKPPGWYPASLIPLLEKEYGP